MGGGTPGRDVGNNSAGETLNTIAYFAANGLGMSSAIENATTIQNGVDHVECYRSFARRCDLSGGWKLMIHGQVVHGRPDNLRRRLLIKLLCRAMKPTPEQLESAVFRERLDSFLVLTCPKTRVSVRMGGKTLTLKRSKRNGMFQQVLDIPDRELRSMVDQIDGRDRLQIAPVIQGLDEKDRISPRVAEADIIDPVGVSVITDIDDTVKVTCVGNRSEMLANTFVNEFRSVEGMPGVYRNWSNAGAAFHYVSSSPWQLYKPLVEFFDREQLPKGSFHLRTLQLQGPSILRLLTGGKRSKKKAIRNILSWYPGRQFVLVGDAGENDPEIYGSISRKHPVQVAGIFIRRVDGANLSHARFERAFRGLPAGFARLFEDPGELERWVPVERNGLIRWSLARA